MKTLTQFSASPDDDRDYPYVPLTVALPPAVDMRRYSGAIEDQGQIGSCTANATCSACETILQRGHRFTDLSRLFNYYDTRDGENWLANKGADLRDAIKSAQKRGLPPESVWPYIESRENVRPDDVAYALAQTRTIGRYERIDLSGGWWAYSGAIKSALAEGCPVVIALNLDRAFYDVSGPLETQSYLGMVGQNPIGAHAVVIVGYLPGVADRFIVENSWGPDWGDQGYFLLRQEVLADVFEAWVVRSFAGLDSVCRTQFLTNQDFCRAWVYANMVTPQLVIDTCVDFELVPSDLEWLMGWADGEVLKYSNNEGKNLNWSDFL